MKYRNFCYDEFKTELEKEILKHNINKMEYQHFLNVLIEILNKYVFMKQKYLKAIKGSLMTKYLQKLAIMKNSSLKNMFLCDEQKCPKNNTKNNKTFA